MLNYLKTGIPKCSFTKKPAYCSKNNSKQVFMYLIKVATNNLDFV